MSLALIEPPLTFTSRRKFPSTTTWPDAALVWPISVALTPPEPFVSPCRNPIGIGMALLL